MSVTSHLAILRSSSTTVPLRTMLVLIPMSLRHLKTGKTANQLLTASLRPMVNRLRTGRHLRTGNHLPMVNHRLMANRRVMESLLPTTGQDCHRQMMVLGCPRLTMELVFRHLMMALVYRHPMTVHCRHHRMTAQVCRLRVTIRVCFLRSMMATSLHSMTVDFLH